jgi:hypothetical protein
MIYLSIPHLKLRRLTATKLFKQPLTGNLRNEGYLQ